MCFLHAEVFDDVLLNLGSGRGGEGKDGYLGIDGVDGSAQTAVFGAEVVAPFRDAVGLVDGEEGDGQMLQKLDGFFLGESLGSDVKQFGTALHQVVFYFASLDLGERRVEEMSHAVASCGVSDGVDLVFHEGDKRRNNDGGTFANHCRELIAERFATARRHDDEGVVSLQDAVNDSLLLAFEIVKAEYFFQLCLQNCHNPKKKCNFAIQR